MRMCEKYGWDEDPRFFQVDGVRWQIEGVDGTIQAPTGQGKTAVVTGPYVMPELLGNRDITIMVIPLLALQVEMVYFQNCAKYALLLTNCQGQNLREGVRFTRRDNQQHPWCLHRGAC